MVDLANVGGLVEQAAILDRLTAHHDLGAFALRVSDVALDDWKLAVPIQCADLHDLVAVRAAVANLTRYLLDQTFELVRDALDHVDPLHAHANVAAVHHGVEHGAVGRAFEVRVRADDHRVFPAQLERAGNQLLCAGCRYLPARCNAARERDLLNSRSYKRGAGFPIPMQNLHDVLRHAGLVQDAGCPVAASRRHLGRFEENRVARKNRLNGWIDRECKRPVPRRDDADDPQGPVVHD